MDFMHHEREVVEMERRRILKNLELHKIEYVEGQAAFDDAQYDCGYERRQPRGDCAANHSDCDGIEAASSRGNFFR